MENRQQLPNSGEQHLKLKTYEQHGTHQKTGSLQTLHQNYDLYIFKFWNIDEN